MVQMSDSFVQKMLSERHIASLATENADGSIHTVAVWYWSDGAKIYVATSGRTRKAQNVHQRSKVSLMIDSRDPSAQRGICIAGSAHLLTDGSSHEYNARIHQKYLSSAALADKRVGPVFAQWDDVTVEIVPASVIAWDMREIDRQAFGGAIQSNAGYLLPLD